MTPAKNVRNNMFNFTKGTFIKDSSKLKEGYRIDGQVIEAVVEAQRISKVFENFLNKNKENKVILFVEYPTPQEQVEAMKLDPSNRYKEIYYLHGLKGEDALHLLKMVGDILINDGNSAFGFIVPASSIQLGKYRFNTMYLMTNTPNAVENNKSVFGAAGIPNRQNLIAPASILSMENPGFCNLYTDPEGKTIDDTMKGLISLGMVRIDTVIDEQYM